jgi:hypothetical protein
MRIKAFAYVYRMTNDTKWVDRCWAEVQVSFVNLVSGGPRLNSLVECFYIRPCDR